MIGQPTYMMGVGATKAGTTWLHRYLAGHPDCHLRAVKELHYFDALDFGQIDRQLKVHHAKVAKLAREAAVSVGAKATRAARALQDVRDWLTVLERGTEDEAAYRAYLEAGLGRRRLVADITPAYAELSADRLRRIAALGDVRFVYLLRDPVARLWSHVRMIAERSRAGAEDFVAEVGRVLDRVLSGAPSEAAKRSDYAAALARLNAAVDPARLLVMFHERMLTTPGIASLCAFLGIGAHPADFSRRVLEGRQLEMTADQAARMRAFLAPQYEFAATAFPDLPEAWRAQMDGRVA